MCTLITSKGTDIDENTANQTHATRTPKPVYLKLTNVLDLSRQHSCKKNTPNLKMPK
jgi:hypothetical protein